MIIPSCPWRFGEESVVTDFLQVENIAVKRIAKQLYDADPNKFVENIADWIRKNFTYPLNKDMEPAAQALRKCGQINCFRWHHSVYKNYIWQYPNEVLCSKFCICIDSANLFVSVMLAAG